MHKITIVTFNIADESSGFFGVVTDEDKDNARLSRYEPDEEKGWKKRHIKSKTQSTCLYEKLVDKLSETVSDETTKPIMTDNCWLTGTIDKTGEFKQYYYEDNNWGSPNHCRETLNRNLEDMRVFEGRFCFNSFPMNPTSRYSIIRMRLLIIFIQSMMKLEVNVICLQEVSNKMLADITRIAKGYRILNYISHGLVTLISENLIHHEKKHVDIYEDTDHRAMTTTFNMSEGKVMVTNMHYYGKGEVVNLQSFITNYKAWSIINDIDVYVLAGDLNNSNMQQFFHNKFNYVHQGAHYIDYICVSALKSVLITNVTDATKTYPNPLQSHDEMIKVKNLCLAGASALENPIDVLQIPVLLQKNNLTFASLDDVRILTDISDHPPLIMELEVNMAQALPYNPHTPRGPFVRGSSLRGIKPRTRPDPQAGPHLSEPLQMPILPQPDQATPATWYNIQTETDTFLHLFELFRMRTASVPMQVPETDLRNSQDVEKAIILEIVNFYNKTSAQ